MAMFTLWNFMLFTEEHHIFLEPIYDVSLVRCMNTINKAEQAKDHSNSPANDILKEPQYAELFESWDVYLDVLILESVLN